MERIIITGAAGNLGSLLAREMARDGVPLRLFWHRRPIADDLAACPGVETCRVDLARPETFRNCLQEGDTIVHFAGVLFRADPQKFLHTTNTRYFRNLLDEAVKARVRRIVLVSFPHVEGETTPENPARGCLDGHPVSVHAATRLEEERLLFAQSDRLETVSLRVGMVYGRGILMIDAARWFSRRWLLGVWRRPTWIHLISAPDFAAAAKAAACKSGIRGIYHVGDEGVQTLQQFLDGAARRWGTKRPWRMPLWMIYAAAWGFEFVSRITGWQAPLTRDFIDIGRVSYYGDTERMRRELLPELRYKTYREGMEIL